MTALTRSALLVAALIGVLGCTCAQLPPASTGLELSLYTGIRQLANIGDSEEKVLEHREFRLQRQEIPADANGSRGPFSHLLFFKDIGTRVYIRNGRVALVEVQDPFQGVVQGKKIAVFKLAPSSPLPWDQALIIELGWPNSRSSGGAFGSEAMYYSWGDISFNGNGPNEIAIYRDPEIVKFRQQRFGRKITLF
ncbi:hypothetical protein K2X33_09040 [bacterium]|nr:hypothetical protein [bacterium]